MQDETLHVVFSFLNRFLEEGLLMVVFVSARVGSYLRSEFGLAFSDFFHFNYV